METPHKLRLAGGAFRVDAPTTSISGSCFSIASRSSMALGPQGVGQLSQRLCHAPLPSILDCPPPRGRNPNAHRLDRLGPSHQHRALSCCKPAPGNTGEHHAAKAMAADEQFFVGAMAAAGPQLQRPALLGAEARYRDRRELL